jgi:hypothetical protein
VFGRQFLKTERRQEIYTKTIFQRRVLRLDILGSNSIDRTTLSETRLSLIVLKSF